MRNSDAWAWILKNAKQLRSVSDSVARKWRGIDRDDFHHSVLVRIVEKFDKLDRTRTEGEVWQWVRWQARAVLTAHRKAQTRKLRECEARHIPAYNGESDTNGSDAESAVMVSQIKKIATPDEWAAVVAKAQGIRGKELQHVLGCAPFSASRRVQRLADKITTQQGGQHVRI